MRPRLVSRFRSGAGHRKQQKKIGHAARFLNRGAETSQHTARDYYLASGFFSPSISFLHSAFILSSAVLGSIFLQASIFLALSASLIAPPWAAAKAPTEAVAKATAINVDINLFMYKLSELGWKGTFWLNVADSLDQK